MQTICLNFYIIFQSGHNISVIIKETNVIIFSGTTINVGDYYCNSISGRAYVVKKGDLTRAKSQGITPIAVIFSTSTSSIDQGHGWNNGYAMALKDANQNTLWSTISGRCIQYVQHTTLTEGQDFQEGYTETHYITDNSNYNENNCPAFFHAINYEASTPSPWLSSHWYLPSIGQWNTILRVLGKSSTSVIQQGVSGNTWENMAATVGTHLNEYLSPVGNGNYTPFASDGRTATWYYSSSEYDATHQLNIALWNDNRVYLFDGIDGSPARSKLSSPPAFVRSVIAF
jgi:hypothetical protein